MSSSTNKFILKSYVNFKYELRIELIHSITQYLLLQVCYTYRVIFSCCFNSYNINIKTAILLSCSRLNSRLSFFTLSFFECGKVDKLIKASLWYLEVLVMSTLETVLLMIGVLCVPGLLRLHRQTLWLRCQRRTQLSLVPRLHMEVLSRGINACRLGFSTRFPYWVRTFFLCNDNLNSLLIERKFQSCKDIFDGLSVSLVYLKYNQLFLLQYGIFTIVNSHVNNDVLTTIKSRDRLNPMGIFAWILPIDHTLLHFRSLGGWRRPDNYCRLQVFMWWITVSVGYYKQ